MKKLSVCLLLTILLYSCYSDDYNDNSSITLELEDAFVLENQDNYVVGDTIFVNLNFSRYLDEEGYSNLLDIYESTGAERFNYDLELEKYSAISNNYVRVSISSEYVFAEKGEYTETNGQVTALLNPDQDVYESRVGIIMAEPGTFKFNFDYVNIIADYEYNKIFLQIYHEFTDANEEDFIFVVSE
jgi:hypothetical protein